MTSYIKYLNQMTTYIKYLNQMTTYIKYLNHMTRPYKIIPVFPVSQPTLFFSADPNSFSAN